MTCNYKPPLSSWSGDSQDASSIRGVCEIFPFFLIGSATGLSCISQLYWPIK
jgi:hypothetical protein